jgi:hypothetical protein
MGVLKGIWKRLALTLGCRSGFGGSCWPEEVFWFVFSFSRDWYILVTLYFDMGIVYTLITLAYYGIGSIDTANIETDWT